MALTDTVKDIADKGKKAGAKAAGTARRQGKRARKEVELRRIERKIRAQKTAIGEAVFDRIESGELQLDIPSVEDARSVIASLREDTERLREDIASLAKDDDDEESATDADADEESRDGAGGSTA